jgi:hypothetical protein
MFSKPFSDKAPNWQQQGVYRQDYPEMGTVRGEEGQINPNIVGAGGEYDPGY